MKYPNIKNIENVKLYLKSEKNINHVSRFLTINPELIKYFSRREIVDIPIKYQDQIYKKIGNNLFRVKLKEYDFNVLNQFVINYFSSVDVIDSTKRLIKYITYINVYKKYQSVMQNHGFDKDKSYYSDLFLVESLIEKSVYKLNGLYIFNSLLQKENRIKIVDNNPESIKILFLIDYLNYLLSETSIDYELYSKNIEFINELLSSNSESIDINHIDSAFTILMNL